MGSRRKAVENHKHRQQSYGRHLFAKATELFRKGSVDCPRKASVFLAVSVPANQRRGDRLHLQSTPIQGPPHPLFVAAVALVRIL